MFQQANQKVISGRSHYCDFSVSANSQIRLKTRIKEGGYNSCIVSIVLSSFSSVSYGT